ncbi:MAG TPA: EAL domain-containing protein [Acidimicrobiales bacterium]|nr:EAL domain-containing protein [Acidimicrobiales bacterium]
MVIGARARHLPEARTPAPASVPDGSTSPSAMREQWRTATLDTCGDGYTVLRAVREDQAIIDWTIVDANELVRDRWRGVGDVVGVALSVLESASDNSAIKDLYCAALATGEGQETDIELILPEGRGGPRRVIVVPVDADTVTVVTRDITRERYFESALQQSRRELRGLAQAATRPSGPGDPRISEPRLLSRSAAFLFVGAGAVAIANTLFSSLPGVDVPALRMTGVLSILTAFLMPLLPWSRHLRVVAASLVGVAIGYLVLSDQVDHYSHSQSAVAVYPIFFIMVVAWSGLIQVRGAPTLAACVSGLALGGILVEGGHGSIGVQCVIVTMPAAAVLGEVMSWSSTRVSNLVGLELDRRLHDPLTGLANRQLFIERTEQALARARRSEHALAVLFMDLDRFKQVNDSLGHAAGDQLLIEAADRLRDLVRQSDDVARLGGDEFVILCEDLDHQEGAVVIAERVLRMFDDSFLLGERDVSIHASIGIAYSDDGGKTAEAILQDADAAMYRAKDAGRARFEFFDDTMQREIAARIELETSLRQAVPRGELRVFYQPIFAATSRAIVGFEALVRWARPGFGLVSPGSFIPVAEETGMIVDIGSWVLNEACRQAAAWSAQWPDRRLCIAVNISSRQVLKGDIVDIVRNALSVSGLDPTLLTLELTETTLIDDARSVQAILLELRDHGVSIALDDFGTGYSSLTYLHAFPIDVIKIDGSFVRTIQTEREAAAIVAAVISLARSLDITVIAEGIESPEQLAAVVGLDCELLQGYLLSHPRAVEELPGLIEGFSFDAT